jgi:hypothetical protein
MKKTSLEHQIYKEKNSNFYVFFERIIKKTKFYKLDNSQVSEFINKNKLDNINVIYKNEYTIVYINPIITELNLKLYVVKDTNDSHRHFVGVGIEGGYTSFLIYGLFLYFDKNNNVSDMIIIPEILLKYDWRNGRIDEKNTFLYNQSLVFLESHRDSGTLIITTCCFNYYDKFIGSYKDYTNIKSDYFCKNNKIENQMLILLDDKTKKYYGFDLASVKITEFNYDKDKINYDIYEIEYDLLDEFIIKSKDFPVEPYGIDYPKNCSKCNNLTSIANLYKNKKHGFSFVNLGSGYCYDCQIRYSLTDKAWLCCLITNYDDGHWICQQKLDSNFNCDKIHKNIPLIIKEEIIHEKKPYKKELALELEL